MIGVRPARRRKAHRLAPVAPSRPDRAAPLRADRPHPTWCDCPAHRLQPGPADRPRLRFGKVALVLVALCIGLALTAVIDRAARGRGLEIGAGLQVMAGGEAQL